MSSATRTASLAPRVAGRARLMEPPAGSADRSARAARWRSASILTPSRPTSAGRRSATGEGAQSGRPARSPSRAQRIGRPRAREQSPRRQPPRRSALDLPLDRRSCDRDSVISFSVGPCSSQSDPGAQRPLRVRQEEERRSSGRTTLCRQSRSRALPRPLWLRDRPGVAVEKSGTNVLSFADAGRRPAATAERRLHSLRAVLAWREICARRFVLKFDASRTAAPREPHNAFTDLGDANWTARGMLWRGAVGCQLRFTHARGASACLE